MAKRQFTDTDTDRFTKKYGNGSDGAKVFSATKTLDSSDGFYNSRITGSVDNFTANTPDLADGTYNLMCKIVQTQGVGANADPNNEYNFLISVSGGVATFKYKLTLNYVSGAQIVTSKQWSTVLVNDAVVISPPAWNGQTGGELFIAGSVSIKTTNTGYFNGNGLGFRGGPAVAAPGDGYQGEGYPGMGSQSVLTPNGNAGGGAWNPPFHGGGFGGNPGGPGANKNNGVANGGVAAGNDDLTSMVMPGSGGSGSAQYTGNSSGYGGNGAANLDFLAPLIDILFHSDGNPGGNATSGSDAGGGSAGAGGNVRCKGRVVKFKSGSSALGNVGGVGQGSHIDGYASSVGRIHADAPSTASVKGTTSPAYTFKVQRVLASQGGAAMLMNLR